MDYMKEHGWEKFSDAGTAGCYTNGNLFVYCDGTGWITSKTPDGSKRYAKQFAKMITAFKFADSKGGKK